MFNLKTPRILSTNVALSVITNSIWRYWVIAIVFGSIFLLLYSVLFLSEQAKGEFKDSQYFTFVDDSNVAMPFESILQLNNDKWSKTETLSFQPTAGKRWLKVEMPPQPPQSVLLHFADPLIDLMTIKVVDHNGEQPKLMAEFTLGDSLPFKERTLKLPYFVVPVKLATGNTTLYISASSKLTVNLAFGVWSKKGFIEFYDHITTFLGVIFGYIMALFCYSFMMFATARKKEYLWYGLYLGSFLLHSMTLTGFGFQYLWPQAIGLQTIMGGATISLTFMCLVKFTQIAIASNRTLYNLIFDSQVYLHSILSLLSIYTLNTYFLRFHLIAVLLSAFLVPIVCMLTSSGGRKTSRFFALVWFVFLMTSLLTIAGRIGLITWKLEPLYSLFFGFHVQTLLIGAALVYEYRENFLRTLELKETALLEKGKTVKAKDEILKLQQDAQLKLEHQVKAQTMQLEGALSDLSSASSELKIMRNFDALTGLPNRLAFEEAVKKLGSMSIDTGKALCVVVLDIDHFKKVNDTYGHLAGDECLRMFSALLKETFKTDDYASCRFGGEEFTLASLLPIEKVEHEVNAFRKSVDNMVIVTGGHDITFTTSAGIASKCLLAQSDSRQIFASADEKLYLAKQKGRNLVIA